MHTRRIDTLQNLARRTTHATPNNTQRHTPNDTFNQRQHGLHGCDQRTGYDAAGPMSSPWARRAADGVAAPAHQTDAASWVRSVYRSSDRSISSSVIATLSSLAQPLRTAIGAAVLACAVGCNASTGIDAHTVGERQCIQAQDGRSQDDRPQQIGARKSGRSNPDAPTVTSGAVRPKLSATVATQLLRRLQTEVWHGIETEMVAPRTGLVYDRIRLTADHDVAERGFQTSPTNVGLQLAALVEAQERSLTSKGVARQKIHTALRSLDALEKDPNGFLYNWFDARDGRTRGSPASGVDARGEVVRARDARVVSSVDNGNFFVALEGVRDAYKDDREITTLIDKILSPMRENFERAFYDPKMGAIRIAYFHHDGQKIDIPYHYSRLGSEARAAVAVLEAEGGLPPGTFQNVANRVAFAKIELRDGTQTPPIVKAWDGGVFQFLLAEVLLGERSFSTTMRQSSDGLVQVMEDRAHDGVPAAYSASDIPGNTYRGAAGICDLAEADKVTEGVVTPHAAFLLAAVDPVAAGRALDALKSKAPEIWAPGIGPRDGILLGAEGKSNRSSDTILALDQLMSFLAGGDFHHHVLARVRSLSNANESSPANQPSAQSPMQSPIQVPMQSPVVPSVRSSIETLYERVGLGT